MYQITLVLLAAVSGGLSQIVVHGTCPITSGSAGPITNIAGTWYQIERIPNPEERGDCLTHWFNQNVTAISNREVYNQTAVFLNGTITRPNSEPYRFTITYGDNLPRDHYVVGTNSANYAVIARCQQITTNNVTTTNLYAWKLSRNSSLTLADSVAINQHLAAIPVLATANWTPRNQSAEACRTTSGAGSLLPSLVALVAAVLFSAKGSY